MGGGGGGTTYRKNQVAALTPSFSQGMNEDLGNAFALLAFFQRTSKKQSNTSLQIFSANYFAYPLRVPKGRTRLPFNRLNMEENGCWKSSHSVPNIKGDPTKPPFL